MGRYKKTVAVVTMVTLCMAVGSTSLFGEVYYREKSPVQSYFDGHAELGKAAAAWLTAKAAMVRAQAEANAANAKAMEDYEKARTLALDNDVKATKTFYEKRQMRETYWAQTSSNRPTKEDLIRYSKAQTPERPATYQFEPTRGKIYWPQVLQDEAFLEERVQLESLFANRQTTDNGVGSPIYGEVQTLAEDMRSALREMMREISPTEYLAARKFIDSLAFEVRFPQRMEGVAAK